MKIVYTFEGEDWKKYKYPPLCHLLNYLFSTNRFTAPYDDFHGDDFGFFKFLSIINLKIEDYEIITGNNIKCFEFNRSFFDVVHIANCGLSSIRSNVSMKELAVFSMKEDNILKIYNGWVENPKNIILAELSVKKDSIEIDNKDGEQEEKVFKLKSYADIIENSEMLFNIKSYIESNYKVMAFDYAILDKLDREYKNKNYEVLERLEKESGIVMKKSDLLPDTQFKIDKEFFKLSDIDKTIENLKKLKILFISLSFVNKRRRMK